MAVSLFRAVSNCVHSACVAPEKWAYATGLLSPRRLNLPDFLGIGAQKAGTTWLHEMLSHHPELFLASPKEVHYFDRRFHRSLSYYARRFDPGAQQVKGEVTPDYATLPLARIRLIRSVMPDLRLVCLLRDPVKRAWSQAQRDLLRARKRSLEEVPAAEFRAHFRSPAARAHGDYVGNLDRWLSVFPADQLFVGFTDDLRERPQELLSDIFRFLGVSPRIDWTRIPYRAAVNQRGNVPMPAAFQVELCSLFAGPSVELACRFGRPVERWCCYPHASRAAGAAVRPASTRSGMAIETGARAGTR